MANTTYTRVHGTVSQLDIPVLNASEIGTIHIKSNQTVLVTHETLDTTPPGGAKVISVGFVSGSNDLCGTFAGSAATYPAVAGGTVATSLNNAAVWQNYKINFHTSYAPGTNVTVFVTPGNEEAARMQYYVWDIQNVAPEPGLGTQWFRLSMRNPTNGDLTNPTWNYFVVAHNST